MLDRPSLYERSARNSYGSYRLSKSRRRWDGVSWWLSSLFAIALVAWAFTWWFGIRGENDDPAAGRVVTFHVTSVENGQPLSGATVHFPGGSVPTDGDGRVAIAFPDAAVDIEISMPGFEPVYGTAGLDIDSDQRISLNPAAPSSTTSDDPPPPSTDAPAGSQPVEATTVAEQPASEPSPTVAPSVTPASTMVPEGDGVAIGGTIIDEAGDPIHDATIRSGSSFARTDENGTFQLADVPAGSDVEVWASGYADQTVASSDAMTVTMQRENINAAYLTGAHLSNETTIQNIIDLAHTTDVNAVVIDMKEGTVYYDTGVQFFIDAQAVQAMFDPAALVQRFKNEGLYTIARIVVFNDPVVAENRPDLAIMTTSGEIWRGYNGAAWVNPYHRELWQPNIDLGIEAAAMGFDEVQFDYVRFPSDGDLSNAEFGTQYTYQEDERVKTIADFLQMARDQLTIHGVKTAADVFAIVGIYPDDQGIGQRFYDFTLVVDYICPMIYPSHFTASPLGMTESPNANPYDTVLITMNSAAGKVPGQELKIRPWIQDFTMGDPPYGVEQVQAQIDAALVAGASGWMLWNPESTFTVGALGDGSGA
ncbi:MAG: hypothetical protein M9947_04880 [Thermomicrobiales bacterium]|nr:hypothetical protein [Thermomicrobiales bacterium]